MFVSNEKKYDWIFILKELISLHVSVIYIVSYLYKIKNWSRSNSFSPLCSLVFIIAKAAYGDVHPPGTSSFTHEAESYIWGTRDKRYWLITSTLLWHDPCIFYSPETILLTSEKLKCDMISHILGLSDLPVIISSWDMAWSFFSLINLNLQILIISKMDNLCMLRGHTRGYFNFKMYVT